MTATWLGTIPDPDTAQLAGWNAFEFSKIVKYPTVVATGDTFANKIGMYTAHDLTKADNPSYYIMWLEYEPYFEPDGNVDKTDAGGAA